MTLSAIVIRPVAVVAIAAIPFLIKRVHIGDRDTYR
jgi:hypothetical protein